MANEKAHALTDMDIRKMIQPKAKKWIRDGGGLALCLTPAKSGPWRLWYYVYKSPETGKLSYKPLGPYPDVTLKAARDEAKLLRAALLNKVDPLAKERREADERARTDEAVKLAREIEEKALTVSGLFDDYMTRHAKLNKRESSWKEDERLFRVNVKPHWGDRKAADIKKRDCIALLDIYTDKPALCINVLKVMRKVFNFALEKDLLEHTPFTAVKAPVTLTTRDRVLSEAEIVKLWNTELPKAAMSDETKRIIKLLLLTGQRVGEVCGITAGEVDGQWWNLPATRSKNKRAHRVYLTKTALEVLGRPVNGFFFPSPVTRQDQNGKTIYTHIDENAVAYAIRKNLKDYQPRRAIKGDKVKMVEVPEARKMELAHFTPHDLRRTANTLLASCKVPKEHRERVLNHALERLDGTYNLHDYDEEKQTALEALERKVLSLVNGGTACKVIPITAAAK